MELHSLQHRISAELIRYRSTEPAEIQSHAEIAARSELQCQKEKLTEELLNVEHQYAEATLASAAKAVPAANVAELKRQCEELQQKIAALEARVQTPGTEYTPLGTTYPKTSSGRRLALARWIADKQNPRTARIAVNHIWLRHFGEALVPTVANFGLNGTPPTHPKLLDWLAAELMEQGWRMKPVHRLIVTSATYRQSSALADEDGQKFVSHQVDPANRWYWRMNSRRMEAEIVRIPCCGFRASWIPPMVARRFRKRRFRQSCEGAFTFGTRPMKNRHCWNHSTWRIPMNAIGGRKA